MATSQNPVFKTERGIATGTGVPKLSYALDSVRVYQFEVHFDSIPEGVMDGQTPNGLTLAAKQVSPIQFGVDSYPVNRVNDKIFYPGKPGPEEVTITFDNTLAKESDAHASMWRWFQRSYNPTTGFMSSDSDGASIAGTPGIKAAKMGIALLRGNLDIVKSIDLYGVFPKTWKSSEFNYGTNEFHTLEVVFSFDYMDTARYEVS